MRLWPRSTAREEARQQVRVERARARAARWRRWRRNAVVGAVLLIVVLIATQCGQHAGNPTGPAGSTPPESSSPRHAAAMLAPTGAPDRDMAATLDRIPIGALDQNAGRQYNRVAQFGHPWLDVDHNGCSTDDDMARRDLTGWSANGRCEITGGSLPVSYDGTGDPIVRKRGALQLDHVNALKHAWMSGANGWTQDMRVAFANDPRNLILTDTHANESKSDRGPSAAPDGYLPPNGAIVCRYVDAFITVTAAYPLTITPGEHDTLADALARCPAPAPAARRQQP